jgi:hypothetical protein
MTENFAKPLVTIELAEYEYLKRKAKEQSAALEISQRIVIIPSGATPMTYQIMQRTLLSEPGKYEYSLALLDVPVGINQIKMVIHPLQS